MLPPSDQLRSVFLRPDLTGNGAGFNCAGLTHHVAPDASSIEFFDQSELAGQWINAVQVMIDRDWTWRGAGSPTLLVSRTVSLPDAVGAPSETVDVGSVELMNTIATATVIAEAAYLIDRQLGAKAEASLYASIIDGQLEVAGLGITDWQRTQDLVAPTPTCGSAGQMHPLSPWPSIGVCRDRGFRAGCLSPPSRCRAGRHPPAAGNLATPPP